MSDLHARAGGVPLDWKVCRFGEVLTASRSPVVVNKGDQYREIGIRSHGKGIFHKETVSGAELGDKRVFWVEPDRLVFNIVFAWERAVAVTRAAEQGLIASHRFPMFRPADAATVDVEFLRRFFLTNRGAQLLAEASPGGAGRNRTLNQKFLADTLVPLPPLSEQRKIAAILSSVDEVVEKTEAVIEQLQVVKKAMMLELLTRGLPGRHTRFKQTEIGEVPEEWEVVGLGSIATLVTSGSRGWAQYYADSGALFVRITNLSRESIELDLQDTKRVALPAGASEGTRTRLEPHDVLVSITADLGIVGIVRDGLGEAYINQHIALVRLDSARVDPAFAARYLASGAVQERLWRLNDAGAKAGLNLPSIRAVPIALPPRPEQFQIDGHLAALDARTMRERENLSRLHETKRALLGVLLTGELRVRPDEDAA